MNEDGSLCLLDLRYPALQLRPRHQSGRGVVMETSAEGGATTGLFQTRGLGWFRILPAVEEAYLSLPVVGTTDGGRGS